MIIIFLLVFGYRLGSFNPTSSTIKYLLVKLKKIIYDSLRFLSTNGTIRNFSYIQIGRRLGFQFAFADIIMKLNIY